MKHDPDLLDRKGFLTIGFTEKVRKCLERARREDLVIEAAKDAELVELVMQARESLVLADDEVIARVRAHNPVVSVNVV